MLNDFYIVHKYKSLSFLFLLIVSTMFVCRRFGEDGLPENSINIKMQGSAGQSFCAFMTKGIHVTLEGDANDYVGKVKIHLRSFKLK